MIRRARTRAAAWLALLLLGADTGCRPKDPTSPTGGPGAAPGEAPKSAREERRERRRESKDAGAYFEDQANDAPGGVPKDAFAVISSYYNTLGAPAPRYDARLAQAASAYAQNVPLAGALPRRFVDYYLAEEGIAEPYPKVVSFAFAKGAEADFLKKLAESMVRIVPTKDGAEQRVGIGVAEREGGKVQVILAILPGRLSLEGVPRSAKPGATLPIKGGVAGGYRNPRLVITGPDGNPFSIRGEGAADTFALDAELNGGAGRYEIEIVADGVTGPEVCGLFSVYAGVALPGPPDLPKETTEATASVEEAEKIIFELVNQERKRAGLAPLAPLDPAQKVARAYSEEMRTTGKVGHISPLSGKPEDRLKKGGVKSSMVLENVARSYSPEDAHAGLMDSPGHRANILNAKVTHLGIGVALDLQPNSPPAYYVTQSFVKMGGEDPKKLAKELPTVINSARTSAGRPALEEDAKLTELAKRYVTQYESGALSREEATKQLFDELGRDFSATYGIAAPLVTVLPYLEPLAKAKGLEDGQFTNYGAAISIASRKSPHGEGSLVVIVLIAGKR